VEGSWTGGTGPRWYVWSIDCARLTILTIAIYHVEALKNDDADDDEGDAQEGSRAESRLAEIEKKTAAAAAQQNPVEKRPTGKVVGIVKRNWRS
jgi:hypothetical protein